MTQPQPGAAALASAVAFREQPKAVPAADRVPYRLGTLLLLLSACRGKSLSLGHIHLFIWSLRSPRTRALLRSWWENRRPMDTVRDRLAPGLDVTVHLAIQAGLVTLSAETRRLRLSEVGSKVAAEITADADLLVIEKEYLSGFGRISDAEVGRRLGGAW
jgi:hypothetical protein